MKEVPLDIIELAAKTSHEINRAYCIGLGDMSQPAWEDAPEWQKISARFGVLSVADGATEERLHESWMRKKKADGWVYGKEKSAEKKTHPCMVRYEFLPEAQRMKDSLFYHSIRGVLAHHGYWGAPVH